MAIRNWAQHSLKMDFSGLVFGDSRPSDIDLFYIGRYNTLIVGEIKHYYGKMSDKQRELYETLVRNWDCLGFVLFITHDKRVEDGDDKVDVARCMVDEYYSNTDRKWHVPRRPTTVYEFLEKYSPLEKFKPLEEYN